MKALAELFVEFNNLKHLHRISPSTLPFLLSYFECLSQPNHMAVEDDSETDYSKLLRPYGSHLIPECRLCTPSALQFQTFSSDFCMTLWLFAWRT